MNQPRNALKVNNATESERASSVIDPEDNQSSKPATTTNAASNASQKKKQHPREDSEDQLSIPESAGTKKIKTETGSKNQPKEEDHKDGGSKYVKQIAKLIQENEHINIAGTK